VAYEIIDHYHAEGVSVGLLCEVLGVSKSGFYKNHHRQKTPKECQDEMIAAWIQHFHEKYKQILGYRRMTMYINRALDTHYCEGYIHRLMQVHGLHSRIRRKKVNRKKASGEHISENLLNREFRAESAHEKWLTDVTEFAIAKDARKLFLSPILDLYGNSILTYKLSFRNNNHLVFQMFEEARQKYPDAKPLFHDDRGFQYTHRSFKKMLDDAGMTHSMSRPGKCIDNGPMEAFFGTLKSEMFHGQKFESMDHLIGEIHAYIDFYNNDRLQKGLGCLSPADYRRQAPQP
jgi:transposase InsO family protein